MKLYGFFQDSKWYEDLGHIFIGFVPGLGWLREHWQWPPGKPITGTKIVDFGNGTFTTHDGELVTQLSRVADSYRDFLGYAIGDILRTITLIGVVIWALVRR